MANSGDFKYLLSRASDNWPVALLGVCATLVTIASTYTTFDGINNFIRAPFFAVTAAFGIQGTMLVGAYLIGESFAHGHLERYAKSATAKGTFNLVALACAVVLLGWGILFVGEHLTDPKSNFRLWLTGMSGAYKAWAPYVLGGLVGYLVLDLVGKQDVLVPYRNGLRIILKNLLLWVLFLGCMSISVFFSFDSHLESVFPKHERQRAGDLRAQLTVSAVVSDVEKLITKGIEDDVNNLLGGDAWRETSRQIEDLLSIARLEPGKIQKEQERQLQEANRVARDNEERIASATAGTAELVQKKTVLTEELTRLRTDRPGLASDYADKKAELDNRARGVDAKRVEAMAEEKGVEGTGKQGRGQAYRDRMGELAKLKEAYKVQEERVRDSQRRLAATDARVAQIERELALIDGQLGKLKSEVDTANEVKKLGSQTTVTRISPQSLGQGISPLETAQTKFRQTTSMPELVALQASCRSLLDSINSVPELKAKTASARLTCEPGKLTEETQRLDARREGRKQFDTARGKAPNDSEGMEKFFEWGKQLIRISGLGGSGSLALRSKLQALELSRDDKTHRFNVTLNAFSDNNPLAWLALAIAFFIDFLVFCAGIWSAGIMRGPLDAVGLRLLGRELKRQPSEHLDDVISALVPISSDDGYGAMIPGEAMSRRVSSVVQLGVDEYTADGQVIVRVSDGTYYLHRAFHKELLRLVARAREQGRLPAVLPQDQARGGGIGLTGRGAGMGKPSAANIIKATFRHGESTTPGPSRASGGSRTKDGADEGTEPVTGKRWKS